MFKWVMKRMRWRAFIYLKSEDEEDIQEKEEHYGLNTCRCPPQIDNLKSFEDDMAKLIGNIQFRKPSDSFHRSLQKDAEYIRGSQDIFVAADKTKNIYRMGTAQYEWVLQENITRHYKIAEEYAYDKINKEAQIIANKLDIADRMDVMARRKSFITSKDHKQNF